jgi:mevalonate kinase
MGYKIQHLLSFSSSYHANGKLLLTGEYLVLHGAKALALPLKFGQHLEVQEEFSSESILWHAFYENQIWFSCELNPNNFSVIVTNDQERASTVQRIFQTIRILNPGFHPKAGTNLVTTLDAHPEWGFGSSSTLISLLSQWAAVDPFKPNELVFNGSGFDIACATANGPIFYIKNQPSRPVELDYPFADQLFLVYSGKKKKTSTEVNTFMKEKKVQTQLIDEISILADEFANCHHQDTFNRLIREHEKLVGDIIGQVPVKEQLFADFDGEIKSLGAWGGDFYLVSTGMPFPGVKKYFENKGLNTMFQWNDLILKRENR